MLKALALWAALLSQSALGAGFVVTNGTGFELEGAPLRFTGSNFYRLGLIDKQSDQQVYDITKKYADRGVKVLRIWGFSCGSGSGRVMLKSAKNGNLQYDETAMRRLDLAIDAASKAGLKLVVALVNYQPEYCSMKWWVNEVTGQSDQHLFYTDARVKLAFKRHITNLLTRRNTLTGYQYLADPAIMTIELDNEAHTEDNYEKNRGIPPGSLMRAWVREMSDFVRSLDSVHLIATGSEGYKTSMSQDEQNYQHQWLSDGSKGSDWEGNLIQPNINYANAHPYPWNWAIGNDQKWFNEHFIADRARIAHTLGKPIVMEESGFPYYDWVNNQWFQSIYTATRQSGYAGTLAWEMVPPGAEDGQYIFDFNSPTAAIVFKDMQ